MNESITIDGIQIAVRRSPRRRTLEVSIDRDGSVLAMVPAAMPEEELRQLIEKRLVWIHQGLERKQEVLHTQSPKEFVTGEGFYYLGRLYRLKLTDAADKQTVPLQFQNGRFLLRRRDARAGREHFVAWYTARARQWIEEQMPQLQPRILVAPTRVDVRDLGFRWGSCGKDRVVYFHWRAILLPSDVIRYLIMHELVHLHEHHHGPAFYERLRRAAPDYEEMEAWLRENGDRFQL